VTKSHNNYQIIAGERRWRAAQRAGLEHVPVVVREVTSTESLEMALIENIHRKDLSAIEEALAYKKLLQDTGTTQEALAKRLGKDRSTITNMLRLLNLPDIIQKDVVNGLLTMGHARVLAGLKSPRDQKDFRNTVLKRGLSVRELEALVKNRGQKKPATGKPVQLDHFTESLVDKLKRSLGTKVDIKKKGQKGQIVIYFYSDDELDRLLDLLS
jgi:ParB family chromosome partitioning protein